MNTVLNISYAGSEYLRNSGREAVHKFISKELDSTLYVSQSVGGALVLLSEDYGIIPNQRELINKLMEVKKLAHH